MHQELGIDEWRAGDQRATDAALCERLPDAPALQASAQALARAEVWEWAEQANRHPPLLQTWDARGRRVDRVDFHPHWHALLGQLRGSGALAAPFEGPGQWRESAAQFYLHGQVEAGSLCPATMTQAAIPLLARHAPSVHAALRAGLHARGHAADDAPITAQRPLWLGMGMTEKQGGSDLRQCATRAEPLGDSLWDAPRYRLDGHKWFFSAPMSDAHLVLAREDAGLSCFLVPRWRLDGSALNGVQIQRLKDKLGNRSNSSSEVEFHGSEGLRIGAAGRGIAILAEMAGTTRLQCVVGSAALLRAALVQALHWSRQRQAFGRPLSAQPLMQQVLADLALESEAATQLMLTLAEAFERADSDAVARAWQRLLTPAAKLWVCKRALMCTGEAMEVLGGNGYVETGTLARLYREAPVNSIWEGSGNVMALDVLRAAAREPQALAAWIEAMAPLLAAPERARLQALPERLAAPDAQAQARALASELALLAQAGVLRQHAPAFVAEAFVQTRLRAPAALLGASALADPAPLLARALP